MTSLPPFPPTWRLLDDVAVMQLPDPAWLVARLLPHRGVGVVYSPPGTGKTTWLAALGVAIPTSGCFFGHRVVEPGAVVYIGAEDPSGFKVRLRAAKSSAGLRLDVPVGCYTFPDAVDLRDAGAVAAFERFLKAQHFDAPLRLIIVDTYSASTPGAAENSSEDTSVSMGHALRWRDALGCTVLIAHHTNASGSRERGHSGMRGSADFMIALTPLDDIVEMTCTKQRNGAPFEPISLRLVPAPGAVAGAVMRLASDVLPSTGLSPMERRAFDALRGSFIAGEGATKCEWEKACTGMPASTFYRVTKGLVEKGYVVQAGTRFRLSPSALTA